MRCPLLIGVSALLLLLLFTPPPSVHAARRRPLNEPLSGSSGGYDGGGGGGGAGYSSGLSDSERMCIEMYGPATYYDVEQNQCHCTEGPLQRRASSGSVYLVSPLVRPALFRSKVVRFVPKNGRQIENSPTSWLRQSENPYPQRSNFFPWDGVPLLVYAE